MIQIANGPPSWGVLEFDIQGTAAGFAQVLDEMRETGYAGTELGDWGFMPTDPAGLREELARRDLQLVGAFVPVNLSDASAHAAGQEVALKIARLLAASSNVSPRLVLSDDNGRNPERTKNAGRIQAPQQLSADQWRVLADGANRIARAVRDETGLVTAFHHHAAGYVETPDEIETFLRLTDPKFVGLCFDTGHYRFGGGDPLQGLQRHFARVRHVHFKDFDPRIADRARANDWDYFETIRHGIYCELGKGEIDFRAIRNFLHANGYDGWIVVEQDVLPGMGTPKESAQRNRDYLRTIDL